MKRIIIILLVFAASGCRRLIEVEPPIREVVGSAMYNTNANAASVLTGMYTLLSGYSIFDGPASLTLRCGLAADELETNAEPSSILYLLYSNDLTDNGDALSWTELYSFIYRTNSALEGIAASNGISASVRSQLNGETKFLRAVMYFHLVNLYGDVPLLLSTNVDINKVAPRTDKALVYEQIVKDLKEAQNELEAGYLHGDIQTPTDKRLRPNKAVATAMLARVYLYMQQWELAEEAATSIINDPRFVMVPLADAFLMNTKEAIWQLQPTSIGSNTVIAEVFALFSGYGWSTPGPNGDSRPVYLPQRMLDAFESGDNRKQQWIAAVKAKLDPSAADSTTYYASYKYKAWQSGAERTEYLVVLRLAEQYLIRAEARARQNRITGASSAAEDLNVVRSRAGLGNTTATTQPAMLDAILHERRIEFFTELGHRWMDLKRVGKIDEVMTDVAPEKNGSWAPYKALFPIPVQDIIRNPSLRGHQNPGYPEK